MGQIDCPAVVLHFLFGETGASSPEALAFGQQRLRSNHRLTRRLCHRRPSLISGWRMFCCRNVGSCGGPACERAPGSRRWKTFAMAASLQHHSELDLRDKTGNRNQRVWLVTFGDNHLRSNSLAGYYRLRNNQRVWGRSATCVFGASSRSWSLRCSRDRFLPWLSRPMPPRPLPNGKCRRMRYQRAAS